MVTTTFTEAVLASARRAIGLKGFSSDQPRDEHGKWTSAGGGDVAAPVSHVREGDAIWASDVRTKAGVNITSVTGVKEQGGQTKITGYGWSGKPTSVLVNAGDTIHLQELGPNHSDEARSAHESLANMPEGSSIVAPGKNDAAPALSPELADAKEALDKGTSAFAAQGGSVREVSSAEIGQLLGQLSEQRAAIESERTLSEMDARGFDFARYALEAAQSQEDMHAFVATADGVGIAGALSVQMRDDSAMGISSKYLLVDYVGTTQVAAGTGTSLAKEAYDYAAKQGAAVMGEPLGEASTFWKRLGWTDDPNGEGAYYHGLSAADVKTLVR